MAKCISPERIPGRNFFFCSSVPYTCSVGPDGLQRDRRQRDVGSVGLVDEDLLLDGAEAQAAVLLGPADAELAVANPSA